MNIESTYAFRCLLASKVYNNRIIHYFMSIYCERYFSSFVRSVLVFSIYFAFQWLFRMLRSGFFRLGLRVVLCGCGGFSAVLLVGVFLGSWELLGDALFFLLKT